MIDDDRPIDKELAVGGELNGDAVHGPRRRAVEIVSIPEIAAAMARAFESWHDGVRLGRLVPGVRVLGNGSPRGDQIAGDVGEVAWGTAQVRTDEADGIEAIRIAVDDHTLVDDHRGGAHWIGARGVGLEGRGVFI